MSFSTKVYVGNLGPKTSEYQLLKMGEPYGRIKDINLVCTLDQKGQKVPRGFAFITFEEEMAAAKAIAGLNGAKLAGRTLKASKANPAKLPAKEALAAPRKRQTLEEARLDVAAEKKAKMEREAATSGLRLLPGTSKEPTPAPAFSAPSSEPSSSSKLAKIQALEAKLQAMQSSEEKFKLAIPQAKKGKS